MVRAEDEEDSLYAAIDLVSDKVWHMPGVYLRKLQLQHVTPVVMAAAASPLQHGTEVADGSRSRSSRGCRVLAAGA